MDILEVFVDESCKDGHSYLAIGGIAVTEDDERDVLDSLARVRAQYNLHGEVKWTNLRRLNLPFYKDFVRAYFRQSAADKAHFHALTLETCTADHKTYNEGSSEIGFDKLVFQLLLHKFGVKYGEYYDIHVYLDRRESVQDPDILRPMLNHVLARDCDIRHGPFKVVAFLDSRSHDLIQCADLLVGCVGSRKNGHHLEPNASMHKIELGKHIEKCAHYLERPHTPTGYNARRFTIWPFAYSSKQKKVS